MSCTKAGDIGDVPSSGIASGHVLQVLTVRLCATLSACIEVYHQSGGTRLKCSSLQPTHTVIWGQPACCL